MTPADALAILRRPNATAKLDAQARIFEAVLAVLQRKPVPPTVVDALANVEPPTLPGDRVPSSDDLRAAVMAVLDAVTPLLRDAGDGKGLRLDGDD